MHSRKQFVRTVLIACIALGTIASTFGFGGSDVFVCFIGGTSPNTGFINHGASNGIRAFSVMTIACNQGDELAGWDDELPEPDNNHPGITQNMYRLREGKMEQIGMSWVKHSYSAENQADWCTKCEPGGNDDALGIGCCDVYGAVVNGSQNAGPRSDVNAATGYFPFPFCSPADGSMACIPAPPTIGRRLQVKNTDLDTDPDVLYFIEVQYIHPGDASGASPPTDNNNSSYRRITINGQGNLAEWADDIEQYKSAIRAWKLNGLGPNTTDSDVQEVNINVPNDGRFWLAAKATDLGSGQYRYEYAVQNLNSDRSGKSFTVPIPSGCGAVVSNIGFHDVDYHSGEPYSLTDWTVDQSSNSITWFTQNHAENVNANALRWGTTYNFRFDCNVLPEPGEVVLGFFKPGSPNSMNVNTVVPGLASCLADIAPAAGNCQVNVDDLLSVINAWGPCPPQEPCAEDITGNDEVDTDDLLAVINNWGACP